MVLCRCYALPKQVSELHSIHMKQSTHVTCTVATHIGHVRRMLFHISLFSIFHCRVMTRVGEMIGTLRVTCSWRHWNRINILSYSVRPRCYINCKLISGKCIGDRLCGLVVRVLDYRCRGPGFDSKALQKKSSGSGTGCTQPREYNWGATW
jgi:hypothetical protein